MKIQLEDKGADVFLCPSIEIKSNLGQTKIKTFFNNFIAHPKEYDWLLFLSANAVRTFEKGMRMFTKNKVKGSIEWRLSYPRICSVGPRTSQALHVVGWPVHRQAKRFDAKGASSVLRNMKNKNVLVPRVEGGPRDILYSIMKKGARVKEVGIYRNQPAPAPLPLMKQSLLRGVDALTFTSASTVRRFFRFFTKSEIKTLFKPALAVAIGPTTKKALIEKGIKKVHMAAHATTDDIVRLLMRKFSLK